MIPSIVTARDKQRHIEELIRTPQKFSANDQVQVANIFSTDPAIAANGFVSLEDTKKLYGSQNIFPLVRADRADEVKETLNAVSAKLTTEAIAGMLKQTDLDKKDPKVVATEFLASNGLS